MLIYHVICVFSSMCWPFFFCYYATLVATRISHIGDVAYDLDWFNYPPEFQKYFILIIARSHQSMYFTGFGLIVCTLEIFGNVRLPSNFKIFYPCCPFLLSICSLFLQIFRRAFSFYVLFRSMSQH